MSALMDGNLLFILSILLVVLVLIFALVLMLFMPAKMCEVAELKGYNPKEYHVFAICFWFNIFGFLYVLGLPDLKLRKIIQQKNNKTSSSEKHCDDNINSNNKSENMDEECQKSKTVEL